MRKVAVGIVLALSLSARAWATPSHVNSTTPVTGTTSCVPTVPINSTNDLMITYISWFSNAGATTITPPTGSTWTLVGSKSDGNNVISIYRRFSNGSEPASYTWGFSANAFCAAFMSDYTGVDTTTPVDTNTGNASGASSIPKLSAFTTTGNNELCIGGVGWSNTSANLTMGTYTEQKRQTWVASTNNGVAGGDQAAASAGSNCSANCNPSVAGWATFDFALNPSAVTPSTCRYDPLLTGSCSVD